MSGGVEGPAMPLPARGSHEPFGARQHLLGSPSREREKENAVGAYALLDQMGDTVHECSCLSGAGTCNDEQRSIAMCWRGCLLRIELGGEISARRRFRDSVTCRIDSRGRRLTHRSKYSAG